MANDLVMFREKFEQFLLATQKNKIGFGPDYLIPAEGSEKEFESLKWEVSRLAGKAQVGVNASGAITAAETAQGKRIKVNPVTNWLSIVRPNPIIDEDDVLDATNRAEARLRSAAGARSREEKSLAGRAAAIIGWPRKVRELAGFPSNSKAGIVTQWTIGGVMFAVITGAGGSSLYALISFMVSLAP